MNAKPYAIAAALFGIVAAYWLGKSGSIQPEPAPAPSPASAVTPEEASRLRSEVASLRAQLAERQASSIPSARHHASPASPDATATGSPSDLLDQAKAALAHQDDQGFLAAFFALLDAGEAGRDPLLALIGSHELEVFFSDAQDDPAISQAVFRGLTAARQQRATALLDAVLSREGAPDLATANALDLFLQFGIRSGLPRERQVALLTGFLGGKAGDAGSQLPDQAADALARLKAVEALPAIEKLLLSAKGNDAWRLIEAVRGMGGPEAVNALKRVAGGGDPELARLVENAFRDMKGEAANAFLWDRIGGEKEPSRRTELWQAIAGRPENTERVAKLAADPATPLPERGAMIDGLLDAGASKAVWDLYGNASGESKDQILARLAGRGDPKAMDLLIQGLGSGQTSAAFAGYVAWADSATLARNQAQLQSSAGNMAFPVPLRGQIAGALARVDRPGAVQALTSGFQGLAEQDRIALVQVLGQRLKGPEAQAFLNQVAGSDPSEAVRNAARPYAGP